MSVVLQDFNLMMQKAVNDQNEMKRRADDRDGTYKGLGSPMQQTEVERISEAVPRKRA